MPGNLRTWTGTWDLAQGTVTDDITGQVFTVPMWRLEVDRRMKEDLAQYVAERDLRADDQNLPGHKPRFRDDWMNGYFPERIKPTGMYPYELGYRSPAPES